MVTSLTYEIDIYFRGKKNKGLYFFMATEKAMIERETPRSRGIVWGEEIRIYNTPLYVLDFLFSCTIISLINEADRHKSRALFMRSDRSTDRPTDGPTDRPTERLIESRARD